MSEKSDTCFFQSSTPLLDHGPRRITFTVDPKDIPAEINCQVLVKSINVEIRCVSHLHANHLVNAKWYGVFSRIDFQENGNNIANVPGGAMIGDLWPHTVTDPVLTKNGSEFIVKLSLPMPFGPEGWFINKFSRIEVETNALPDGMHGSISMNGGLNYSLSRIITEMQRTGLIYITEKESKVTIYGEYGKSFRIKKIYLVSTVLLENVYFHHTNADMTVSAFQMYGLGSLGTSGRKVYLFDSFEKINFHEKSVCECKFDRSLLTSQCGFIEGVIIVEKPEQEQSSKVLEFANAKVKHFFEKIDKARNELQSLISI